MLLQTTEVHNFFLELLWKTTDKRRVSIMRRIIAIHLNCVTSLSSPLAADSMVASLSSAMQSDGYVRYKTWTACSRLKPPYLMNLSKL